MGGPISRRELIKRTALAGASLAASNVLAQEAAPASKDAAIPKRPLGKTGAMISAMGIGGFHLGTIPDEAVSTRLVHEAIDKGINFFDNAWEYNKGLSEKRLGTALLKKRQQVFLMTKVCTHGRDKKVALHQLEQSLKRLHTDHLDLWQVHECVYFNDPERHYAEGGVLEALDQAKKEGKVRFVGFTGHKDPAIHLQMLSKGYAFDTVQMPLNCFDATFRSFEQQVLPIANQKQLGVLGMKSMGGDGQPIRGGSVNAHEALRYAMSLPVSTTISGVDSLDVLRQNLLVAQGFTPFTDAEMQALRDRCALDASEGQYELYKTTKRYDAAEGRAQHGYPSPLELPL